MGRVVLDTSVWVNIERFGSPEKLIRPDDLPILPAAALAELRVATKLSSRSADARGRARDFIQQVLQISEFAPIDLETTEAFAELKAHCLATGKQRGVNDLWVAAAAIRHRAELISLDSRAIFHDLPGVQARF